MEFRSHFGADRAVGTPTSVAGTRISRRVNASRAIVYRALVMLVSQDGGLRFIRWSDDGVTYWEQVATGLWEV
jgi:hypothetical protein